MTDILEQARVRFAALVECDGLDESGCEACITLECVCRQSVQAILALVEPKWPEIDDAMVERTAIAIEATMFAPHELPLDSDLHEKYLHTTRVGLEAAFTQFSLPLPPKEEQ